MTVSPDKLQEEVDLREILRVVWKWRYLILAGTLICGLIAGVISWNQPKIYQTSMLLQPAVVWIDSRGRKTYIESPEAIKKLIEAGAFNRETLDSLKNPNSIMPKALKFKVHIPRRSDSLMISYGATDVDLGITILENLAKQLLATYNEDVEKFRNNYKSNLQLKRNRLSSIEIENKVSTEYIERIAKRINFLLTEMEEIDKKIKLILIGQSKNISNVPPNKNINSTILHNNLLQQLTTIKMIYKNEIDDYFMQTERENDRLKLRQNEADIIMEEIRSLENEMSNIQNIRVVKSPSGSRRPIRPKTKLIMVLGSLGGLVTMLFLAFFLEYVAKHRGKKD
jgi:hypothetical protein